MNLSFTTNRIGREESISYFLLSIFYPLPITFYQLPITIYQLPGISIYKCMGRKQLDGNTFVKSWLNKETKGGAFAPLVSYFNRSFGQGEALPSSGASLPLNFHYSVANSNPWDYRA